jgi:hypothetical protein
MASVNAGPVESKQLSELDISLPRFWHIGRFDRGGYIRAQMNYLVMT